MAASKSNLLRGCKVISADKLEFKHSLIKSVFFFLISLNSGRYLPACLIIHMGFKSVFPSLITFLMLDILIIKFI